MKFDLIISFLLVAFLKGNECATGIRFGCHFKDILTFYITNPGEEADMVPRFENKLEPQLFLDHMDMEKYINLIESHLNIFYNDYMVDSIGPFIKFYKDYQKSKSKNLEKFFKTYKYEFNFSKPENLIEMYVLFFMTLRASEQNVYFAAVQEEVPEDFVKHGNFKEPETSNYLTHTVAVVRIKIGETNPREGFIIFDHYTVKPVILMKDKGKFHTGSVKHIFQGEKIFVTKEYTLSSDGKFVIVEYKTLDTVKWRDLIYVEKSFCSFNEITQRMYLINNVQVMHFLNRHYFKAQASLFFDLNERDTLQIYQDGDISPFDLKKPLGTELENFRAWIKDAQLNFRQKPEELTERIRDVVEVFSDNNFLDNLWKLFKIYKPNLAEPKKDIQIAKPVRPSSENKVTGNRKKVRVSLINRLFSVCGRDPKVNP